MGRKARYRDLKDPAFLGVLNDELDDIHRRLDRQFVRKEVLAGVTVRTSSTELRHRLGKAPKVVQVLPRSDARVWQSAAATAESVFLAASVNVLADVYLET